MSKRKFALDEDLCKRLEAVQATLDKDDEPLTPFIKWILKMFCKDHEEGRIVSRFAGIKGDAPDEQRNTTRARQA